MKKCYLLLVLAAVITSCTKDNTAVDEQPIAISKDKIYATIGGEEDKTRVQLNEELKSVWNSGDESTL